MSLQADVTQAVRQFSRRPGFALAIAVTLALGIGANAAILSFVHAILMRPLPFTEPDRLVAIEEINIAGGRDFGTMSVENAREMLAASRTVGEWGAWRDWGFQIRVGDEAENVYGGIASPSLFTTLGARTVAGRLFDPGEDSPGRNQVVLLSHRLWQRRFAGDPGVVGRELRTERGTYVIAGVLAPDFDSPELGPMDVWAPHSVDEDLGKGRWLRNRRVYARLRPGASVEAAERELAAMATRMAASYPETNEGWSVRVTPLHEYEVGYARPALLVFLGATGFVLLIACVNIANLLLGRIASRKREFALRTAVGASRGRIIRQVLVESTLLAVPGGILGILLALWLTDLFVTLSPPGLPRLDDVAVSGTVVLLTLALTVLAGLVFGVVPAYQSSGPELDGALREGRGNLPGRSTARTHGVLLVAEVALAVALLTGAGLLARSLLRMQRLDLGLDTGNLLTFSVGLTQDYTEAAQVRTFLREADAALAAMPGVRAVGATSASPLFGGFESLEFAFAGGAGTGEAKPEARYFDVSPGYFETVGMRVLRGRGLLASDDESAPAVAVVNRTMAERYWPGADPLGKRIAMQPEGGVVEIVGVVEDVRRPAPGAVVVPEIYWPKLQHLRWFTYFVLRADGDPAALAPAVRERFRALDPRLLPAGFSTMSERRDVVLRQPRFQLALVALFALVATTLAGVGIFGVISFGVAERAGEMGIRMALGARKTQIFRMVLARGTGLAAVGAVIGLAIALALRRFLAGLLFGVEPGDPMTFALTALAAVVTAAAACTVPAWRAARGDPAGPLRSA
jgi:putative ABC transport system permease protein